MAQDISLHMCYNKRKENSKKLAKTLHLEGMGMYRYSNGQISLSDFQQPMGMHLREDNRWVRKAQIIPWDKIEARYADLFPSSTGNVAKPLQLALQFSIFECKNVLKKFVVEKCISSTIKRYIV